MGWKLDEADGLVLTVAILWDALHAGVGRGGPGAWEAARRLRAHAQINSGNPLK